MSKENLPIVKLKQAFSWQCPWCYTDNFAEPKIATLTEDERDTVYLKFNHLEELSELPEEWREFELVTIPREVTCKKCGLRYGTVDRKAR